MIVDDPMRARLIATVTCGLDDRYIDAVALISEIPPEEIYQFAMTAAGFYAAAITVLADRIGIDKFELLQGFALYETGEPM